MLVLTRKVNEQIRIGNAVITVLRGDSVRLGIEAPREVPIVRGELPEGETCNRQTNNSTDGRS